MDHVKTINEAAATLAGAITTARAAGYRVGFTLSTLDRIEVSETAAVKQPEPAPDPVPPPAKPAKA
jgi:hypothetical protein